LNPAGFTALPDLVHEITKIGVRPQINHA